MSVVKVGKKLNDNTQEMEAPVMLLLPLSTWEECREMGLALGKEPAELFQYALTLVHEKHKDEL